MGILKWLTTLASAAVGAILLGLIKDEITAWLPRFISQILSAAVEQVPEDQKLIREEEWKAHLKDYPGKISQLFVAFGIYRASCNLQDLAPDFIRSRSRICIIVISFGPLVNVAPHWLLGENGWTLEVYNFALFNYTLAAGWSTYWLIRLKPFLVGDRRPPA